jgi:hypothetical protein
MALLVVLTGVVFGGGVGGGRRDMAGWSEAAASMQTTKRAHHVASTLSSRSLSPLPLQQQQGDASSSKPSKHSELKTRSADFEAKVRLCREHISKLAAETRATPSPESKGSRANISKGAPPSKDVAFRTSFLSDRAASLASKAVGSPATPPPMRAQPRDPSACKGASAEIAAHAASAQARVGTRAPRHAGGSPAKGGPGVWAR